jgi:hypothetical protein
MNKLALFSALLAAVVETLAPLAAILLLALFSIRLLSRLQGSRAGLEGEARVSRVLRRHFEHVADDVILPDGRGGLTQIDHLALTPVGVLVIETKNYGGRIYAQKDDRTWTQVMGRRRHRFQNPLRQNYAHTKAVGAIAPTLPVRPQVVFMDRARFPKSMPEGVLHLSEFRRAAAAMRGDIPAAHLAAWRHLIAQTRTDQEARDTHLKQLQARFVNQAPRVSLPSRQTAIAAAFGVAGLAIAIGFVQQAARQAPAGFAEAAAPIAEDNRPGFRLTLRWRNSDDTVPDDTIRPHGQRITADAPADDAGHAIAWSDTEAPAADGDSCEIARIAVSVADNAGNRAFRDRACGTATSELPGDLLEPDKVAELSPAADDPIATTAKREPVVIDGSWRTLRSAADITR